jgi:hypothetical protein
MPLFGGVLKIVERHYSDINITEDDYLRKLSASFDEGS